MGYISQIEDPLKTTNNVIWKERPVKPVGDFGWELRNATYTLGNTRFGTSPFGDFPAPQAVRKFPWEVSMYGKGGFDSARDNLAAAIGLGRPVRLVYHHDLGYERVVNKAVAYKVTAPYTEQNDFFYTFKVEYELNEFWTERSSVDSSLRCGEIPVLRCGESPALRCGEGGTTATINADNFTVPSNILDSSLVGSGGIANYPDTGPIITISGPYGGALGFTIQSLTDPYNAFLNFTSPIVSGVTLVIDCGAKKASSSLLPDVSGYLTWGAKQPYIMAVNPGVANIWLMVCNGGSPTHGGTIHVQWQRYWS